MYFKYCYQLFFIDINKIWPPVFRKERREAVLRVFQNNFYKKS
jgi:hypothetical protein